MKRPLRPAGVRSLAVAVPTRTRTITLPSGQSALRHTLPDGQSGLDLTVDAAREAIAEAGLEPRDVDLVLDASFPALPEPGIGNATPLAWEMGMEKAAAWNVESACAGGLLALRTACQEVALGEYETVLVVVGCPYSQTVEDDHPAYDVIGDAAYAMVVGPTRQGEDFLGSVVRNSGPTCCLVAWTVDLKVPSGLRLTVDGKTAGKLEAWGLGELPAMARTLFERTGLSPSDVDHWVCNAPTPCFVDRALEAMGGAPRNGVNTNRLLGNVGPALFGAALFYNALLRDFRPGDLVFCCSMGSESSLAISLLGWPSGVGLGAVPANASLAQMEEYETERLGLVTAA